MPRFRRTLLARFDRDGDGRLSEQEEQAANELLKDTEFMSDGVVVANPLRALVSQTLLRRREPA